MYRPTSLIRLLLVTCSLACFTNVQAATNAGVAHNGINEPIPELSNQAIYPNHRLLPSIEVVPIAGQISQEQLELQNYYPVNEFANFKNKQVQQISAATSQIAI